jgi:hypothetical protein
VDRTAVEVDDPEFGRLVEGWEGNPDAGSRSANLAALGDRGEASACGTAAVARGSMGLSIRVALGAVGLLVVPPDG